MTTGKLDSTAYDLRHFTPTACALLGITPPDLSCPDPIHSVIDAATGNGNPVVDRMLVYAPDAIGGHLMGSYGDDFARVRACAPVEVPLSSIYPSFTPVCFSSLFTGMTPEQHGIARYEKPVLKKDTIFDALLRQGKRVAIVTVAESSIAKLFLERDLDYYVEQYDPLVTKRTMQLIEQGEHDFILSYHQQYDDHLHLTEPFSDLAIAAFKMHVSTFERLAEATARHWSGVNYALAFTPDHGAHYDEAKGIGMHGTDQPEDMDIFHYWKV